MPTTIGLSHWVPLFSIRQLFWTCDTSAKVRWCIGRSRWTQHYQRARAVVLASGGFEADKDWLASAWGDAARNFLDQGQPYNTGEVLKGVLAGGADQVGDPTQCHAVAIDGRAPEYDGGIVTRVDCVPFSVVVNNDGHRFYDEGEDVWPKLQV